MSDRLHLPRIPLPVEPIDGVLRRGRARVAVITLVLGGLLAGVGARGIQLCLSPSDRTIREGSAQRWDQVTLRARRGEILDREGRRLATSVATPNIVVDPMRLEEEEIEPLSQQLASILGVAPGELQTRMRRNTRYARLAMRVHPRIASEVEGLGHPALWAEQDTRRYYPEGALASQLLGFVDAGGIGREGLEAALDDQLRGGAVLMQRRRDRRGLDVDRPAANGTRANEGRTVHLTIDRTIQRYAERALAGVLERHEPASASAVVVDVKTGDLLALANAPSFNPNAIGDDAAARKNHVVQDAIEPGSVFKPFTMAAAVEEGLVEESTIVDCEGGAWYIGRTRIRDDHPRGRITASEIIKYSSNIGSAKLALRIGPDVFLDYLKAFGFAERTGIQLPGERRGVLRAADRIRPIELATTAYGQGTTSTQLQMAMATASLANDGVRMQPRLVTRIEDAHGVPEVINKPTIARRVVSAETARAVGRMMVTVTEQGGTATRARVPGYKVAGKTGTAEKVKDGRYSSARIGSFMGFVPADDPKLAIVVTVDEPSKGSRYGGIVAAPAFAEIAGLSLRHLGVPPDPELLGDDDAVADLDDIEDEEPEEAGPVRMAWDGASWQVPDLKGRSLRQVLAGLSGSGLRLELKGTGHAIRQEPAAGSRVKAGGSLAIIFE